MAKFATQFEADAQALATKGALLLAAGGMSDLDVALTIRATARRMGYDTNSSTYSSLLVRCVQILAGAASNSGEVTVVVS